MKAEFTEYAGRLVLEIHAKTKQEQKDLDRFVKRCEKGFEILDRNHIVYPTYSPVKINGTCQSADGCSRTCIESINEQETKDAVYAKTLEYKLSKKSWWKFWVRG